MSQPSWQESMHAAWPAIRDNQDDCLLAIEDGKPLPVRALQALPPWRAVMLAGLAARLGIPLERGNLRQLHAEARAIGGDRVLGDWWLR